MSVLLMRYVAMDLMTKYIIKESDSLMEIQDIARRYKYDMWEKKNFYHSTDVKIFDKYKQKDRIKLQKIIKFDWLED